MLQSVENNSSPFLIILLSLIIPIIGNSQNPDSFIPDVFPEAPNTASLYKFQNYQVNQYSGVPDINIPLYEIKMGEVTVPLALRYHASGIKVTERASWVGLGWALGTGGEITRRVMGGVDESASGYLDNNLRDASDIDVTYPNPPDLYFVSSVAKGDIDTEPDIFSYKLPGKSGKFFFNGNDNYKPVCIPYSPISIIKKELPNSNRLSFEIKDELGYRYFLGEDTREITQSSKGGNITYSTSSWKLDRIYSSSLNDSITYSYYPADLISYDDYSHTVTISDKPSYYSTNPVYSYSGPIGSSTAIHTATGEYKTKEINFKNGKVVFELSESIRDDMDSKRLKKIIVYRKSSSGGFEVLKEIEFITSYFINEADSSIKRLRLDAINIINKNSGIEEIYEFDYNDENLPSYTSTSRDYWGYYNGKNNNTLVPRQRVNVITSTSGGSGQNIWIGSNISDGREPDEEFMKAGSLKRIIYPTGGYTDFEFEANRYINSDNVEQLAGGLRIKEVKSFSSFGDTTPLIKKYEYNSSRPNFDLSHYAFFTQQSYKHYSPYGGSGPPAFNQSKRVRHFVSTPTMDVVPYDGIPVSYSKVTEYEGDGNSVNGKVEYEFTDQADISLGSAISTITGKPWLISRFYERGQLKSKKIYRYDTAIDDYEKIKEALYNYSSFPLTQFKDVGLKVAQGIVYEGAGRIYSEGQIDERYKFDNYDLQSNDNYLVAVTERSFDAPSSPTTIITNYDYGNIQHQQVTRKTVTDSKEGVTETTYHYPDDVKNTNTLGEVLTPDEYDAIDLLKKNGLHQTAKRVQIEKVVGGGSAIERTNYKEFSPDLVLPINKQTSKDGEDLENRVIYHHYDNYGNPIEVSKADGPSVIYLWGYNKQYPIAKIEGGTYNAVASELGVSNLNAIDEGDLVAINNLRATLSNAQVTTYTYEPLVGVTTITDPRGKTTTYEYDNFNRLEFIRDDEGHLLEEYKYNYKTE